MNPNEETQAEQSEPTPPAAAAETAAVTTPAAAAPTPPTRSKPPEAAEKEGLTPLHWALILFLVAVLVVQVVLIARNMKGGGPGIANAPPPVGGPPPGPGGAPGPGPAGGPAGGGPMGGGGDSMLSAPSDRIMRALAKMDQNAATTITAKQAAQMLPLVKHLNENGGKEFSAGDAFVVAVKSTLTKSQFDTVMKYRQGQPLPVAPSTAPGAPGGAPGGPGAGPGAPGGAGPGAPGGAGPGAPGQVPAGAGPGAPTGAPAAPGAAPAAPANPAPQHSLLLPGGFTMPLAQATPAAGKSAPPAGGSPGPAVKGPNPPAGPGPGPGKAGGPNPAGPGPVKAGQPPGPGAAGGPGPVPMNVGSELAKHLAKIAGVSLESVTPADLKTAPQQASGIPTAPEDVNNIMRELGKLTDLTRAQAATLLPFVVAYNAIHEDTVKSKQGIADVLTTAQKSFVRDQIVAAQPPTPEPGTAPMTPDQIITILEKKAK